MTSHLCQHMILTTLLGCTGLAAGAAERSTAPVKEKIDLDIVSIAYFEFKDLHVWRNDNGKK